MNSRRICDRLWKAELAEPNTHLRSDYRQAWIIVRLASRGEAEPFIASSYRMFGVHPDEVWPNIMAERKAKLGLEYDLWYFPDGTMRPDVIIPDYDPLESYTMRSIPDGWQGRLDTDRQPFSVR